MSTAQMCRHRLCTSLTATGKLPPMDFHARQKKLREHLATTRFDALLISHLPNIRYLCGFTGSAGLLLVEQAGSIFFSDFRYDTQAHDEVKVAKVVIARKSVLQAWAEFLGRGANGREDGQLASRPSTSRLPTRSGSTIAVPPECDLKDASPVVERVRMVKDAEELERIRAAVNLGAKLFDRALEVLRPGVKETEVAAEMEYAARRAGPRKCRFPTIIAVGSALGVASRAGFGPGNHPGRVRGLRLRCYTFRLLFRPDPHCMGGDGRGSRGCPTGLRGGSRGTAGGN